MKPEEPATTGADLLVKALIDEEVEVVFGYPGGPLMPLYDALYREPAIRHVLARDEQAAAFAVAVFFCGVGWFILLGALLRRRSVAISRWRTATPRRSRS